MTVCWNERRGLEEGGGGGLRRGDAAPYGAYISCCLCRFVFRAHVCVCVRALAIMHAFVVNGSCKKHIRMYACV